MEMPGHFALRPSAPQRFARDRSVDTKSNCAISRRAFVAGSGGLALAALTPSWPAGAASRYTLVAAAGSAPPVGSTYQATAVWSYNGTVPGPALLVRQGERRRGWVDNLLEDGNTIHWPDPR